MCDSSKTWKDGIRRTNDGDIQRYLCRECGYRFSQASWNRSDELEHVQRVHREPLNTHPSLLSNRQICVTQPKGTKNLVKVEPRTETALRESTQDTKGKIIEYIWFMKKQGYAESTIKTRTKILKQLVKRGAILDDPESIKKIIAEQTTWNEGTKSFAVVAYSSYLNKEGKIWTPPRYRRKEKIPFIPTEKELDQLISSSGKKLSIYLQCCKETGSDPGELLHMEWIDINKENSTVTINHPVKGHNPRIIPVSQELIGRLETLPKKTEKIFNTKDMYPNLFTQRRRAAKKFNNPRLLKISFVTIRHWKGTMEYHRTKDILHVKQLLGHKQIQNTMVYINLENAVFNNKRKDEFTVRIAHNLEEAIRLAEAGFDRFDEIDSQKLYRKRK